MTYGDTTIGKDGNRGYDTDLRDPLADAWGHSVPVGDDPSVVGFRRQWDIMSVRRVGEITLPFR